MIRRLLLTATQYNYSLLHASIIIISRKYSLSADESFELKHKKLLKRLLELMWIKKKKQVSKKCMNI